MQAKADAARNGSTLPGTPAQDKVNAEADAAAENAKAFAEAVNTLQTELATARDEAWEANQESHAAAETRARNQLAKAITAVEKAAHDVATLIGTREWFEKASPYDDTIYFNIATLMRDDTSLTFKHKSQVPFALITQALNNL